MQQQKEAPKMEEEASEDLNESFKMFQEECNINPQEKFGGEMLDFIDLRDMVNQSKRKNNSKTDVSPSKISGRGLQGNEKHQIVDSVDPASECPVVYPVATSTNNFNAINDIDLFTITEMSEKTELTRAMLSQHNGIQSADSFDKQPLLLRDRQQYPK